MKNDKQLFFGSTTVSEKGQTVIPAEARSALKLKKGEKLLVFSMGPGMIALAKLEYMARFEKNLSYRLQTVRRAVKTA